MILRTTDVGFIKRIMTDPSVWPFAVEEGHDPKTWEPPMGGAWLTIHGVMGLVFVYQVCGSIYAYDAAILPQSRAPKVGYSERRSHIVQIKHWLRANTDCTHLIAFIAEDNTRSMKAARADGLVLEGRIPKCKRRGGTLIDALIFGTGV